MKISPQVFAEHWWHMIIFMLHCQRPPSDTEAKYFDTNFVFGIILQPFLKSNYSSFPELTSFHQ